MHVKSNEPIGIEQEQVKSASVLSKKKNSGKKRIKFTKEEDDAIRDGVRVLERGIRNLSKLITQMSLIEETMLQSRIDGEISSWH